MYGAVIAVARFEQYSLLEQAGASGRKQGFFEQEDLGGCVKDILDILRLFAAEFADGVEGNRPV